MRPNDEDIETGIVLPEVYDGISVWLLKDGSMVNRWEGIEGMERRYNQTQQYINFRDRAVRDALGGQANG
ncbi:hypothetical protein [Glycomyces sp. NPDC021274]|uniref:hypothetical protein n=1 Tax=Glycomyces sp. NPDC021274 TaxID=3155120 RepID=UPI0033D8EB99